MKTLFLSLSCLIFSNVLFSSEVEYSCTKLINGNDNGKAYVNAKEVDLELKLDIEKEDAEISGKLTTKAGKYHAENNVIPSYSYFLDNRKFKKTGSVITISSFERDLVGCVSGPEWGPCRSWDKLELNINTGEVLFEKSYSNDYVFGEVTYKSSLRMICLQK